MSQIIKKSKTPRIPKYYKNFCSSVDLGYLKIELVNKCQDNRLHYLEYILTNPELSLPKATGNMFDDDIINLKDELMQKAINNRAYKVMEFLLESPKLEMHANIDLALRYAFNCDDIDTMRFLLSSPTLKKHANINVTYKAFNEIDNEKRDSLLTTAARKGNLVLVEFLLSDSCLKEPADIHILDDKAVYKAVLNNHLEVTKFLLSSKKINEHAKLNESASIFFAVAGKNKEMCEYLILDYGIKKTDKVIEFLDHFEETKQPGTLEHYVNKLFTNLDEYKSLNKDLEVKLLPSKKKKI